MPKRRARPLTPAHQDPLVTEQREQARQEALEKSPPGTLLLTCKGHRSAVLGVAWSPDGRRLASASYDQTARVWRV